MPLPSLAQPDFLPRLREQLQLAIKAGGLKGRVKATATGEMAITDITIDPAAVDPEDVEMLQDLVISAVNEALRQAEEAKESAMGALTGGLNIPGLF